MVDKRRQILLRRQAGQSASIDNVSMVEVNARRPAAVDSLQFLGLVVLLSVPLYALLGHAGTVEIAHGRAIHLLMWAPAIATFAVCATRGIGLDSLGWHWRPVSCEWMGWALPFLYGTVTYGLLWAFRLAPWTGGAALAQAHNSTHLSGVWAYPVEWILLMSYGLVNSLASALGEEIGWRGFLAPRLVECLGYGPGMLASGLIWAAWHVPILLFADYNIGTSRGYQLMCFTVMIVATGTMAGWLRLRSGSLWPAALLHAAHNLWIQQVLDPLAAGSGQSLYWTGEFGAGLAVVTASIALLWFRRDPRQRPVA